MAGTSKKDQAILRRRIKEASARARALEADLRRVYKSWFKEWLKQIERTSVKKQGFILPRFRGLVQFAPIFESIQKIFRRRLRFVYTVNLSPEFPTAIGLSFDRKDALASRFIRDNGVKLAGFAQRDNKRISKILADAVKKGDSTKKISEKLNKLFDGFTTKRVKHIAEQTTATAQIVAQKQFWEEAAPETAKTFRKFWLPSIGGRFDRTNHNALKSVKFNTKFRVPSVKVNGIVRPGTAARMDHPRDPSAPLEQVLKCK